MIWDMSKTMHSFPRRGDSLEVWTNCRPRLLLLIILVIFFFRHRECSISFAEYDHHRCSFFPSFHIRMRLCAAYLIRRTGTSVRFVSNSTWTKNEFVKERKQRGEINVIDQNIANDWARSRISDVLLEIFTDENRMETINASTHLFLIRLKSNEILYSKFLYWCQKKTSEQRRNTRRVQNIIIVNKD